MALQDSYTSGENNEFGSTYGVKWSAITFEAGNSYTILSVQLKLVRVGAYSGSVDVSIRTTSGNLPIASNGADLCSGSIPDASVITTDAGGDWYEITLGAGTALTSSVVYAIVIRNPTATQTV